MSPKRAPILIMAGGTGGHVFPALALARLLRAASHEVVWLGTKAGLEARVIPAENIDIEWLVDERPARQGRGDVVSRRRSSWCIPSGRRCGVMRRRRPRARGGFRRLRHRAGRRGGLAHAPAAA